MNDINANNKIGELLAKAIYDMLREAGIACRLDYTTVHAAQQDRASDKRKITKIRVNYKSEEVRIFVKRHSKRSNGFSISCISIHDPKLFSVIRKTATHI